MKTPRTIVVKTLMNPDEFLAFEKTCKTSDVSHSRVLRDLANRFVANRNTNCRRRHGRSERPSAAHNLAMILPARGGASRAHMRL